MNVYNKSSIIQFYKKHDDAKILLDIWYREVESIIWEAPNYLKLQFSGSVSILRNSRAVFDVKGNNYRIVAAINYLNAWVFIKFIGTHSQYDRIDANTIDMFQAKKKKN